MRFRSALFVGSGIALLASWSSCSNGYGTACETDDDCKRVDVCDDAVGRCVPKSALPGDGDECIDDVDCAVGSTCLLFVCTSGELDAYCIVDDDCVSGLICNSVTDTCKAGIEGDPCDDFWFDCAEPLTCREGACGAPAALGEDCSDLECAPGLVCVFAYNPPLCMELGEEGDPCAFNDDCAPGLVCAGETIGLLTCTPQPDPG